MGRLRLRRPRPLSFFGGLVKVYRGRNHKPTSVTVGPRWWSWNSRRRTWRGVLGPVEYETDRPE